MAAVFLPLNPARHLDNLCERYYIFSDIKRDESRPRRFSGVFPGLWWSFFRSRGQGGWNGGAPGRAVWRLAKDKESCPVIDIVVYIVKLRNGGLLAWTTIWPSVPSAVLPWPGKTATSLRHTLLTTLQRKTVRRVSAKGSVSGKRSRAELVFAALAFNPTETSSPIPSCFCQDLTYSKSIAGNELPSLLLCGNPRNTRP